MVPKLSAVLLVKLIPLDILLVALRLATLLLLPRMMPLYALAVRLEAVIGLLWVIAPPAARVSVPFKPLTAPLMKIEFAAVRPRP